jgi:hypothetical protein
MSFFFKNYEQNSTLEDQNGTNHQFYVNSFHNEKFPESNEMQSFQYKLVSESNEIFLTVLAKKSLKPRKYC